MAIIEIEETNEAPQFIRTGNKASDRFREVEQVLSRMSVGQGKTFSFRGLPSKEDPNKMDMNARPKDLTGARTFISRYGREHGIKFTTNAGIVDHPRHGFVWALYVQMQGREVQNGNAARQSSEEQNSQPRTFGAV